MIERKTERKMGKGKRTKVEKEEGAKRDRTPERGVDKKRGTARGRPVTPRSIFGVCPRKSRSIPSVLSRGGFSQTATKEK